MRKVIIVYANCRSTYGLGDYSFAGNIALNLVQELVKKHVTNVHILLATSLNKLDKYHTLYGQENNGRVFINGIPIEVTSIEQLDPVANTVLAFVDAAPCAERPMSLIRGILSPESQLISAYQIQQVDSSDLLYDCVYNKHRVLFDPFAREDVLVKKAGFASNDLGLPVITSVTDLPSISSQQKAMIPTNNYGFIYADNFRENQRLISGFIAQYVHLTGMREYVLVGQFAEQYLLLQNQLSTILKLDIKLRFHQSLPNVLMRKMMVDASTLMVLLSGVGSSLEALAEGKIIFFQAQEHNEHFAQSFYNAAFSMLEQEASCTEYLPQRVLSLLELLFKPKPLSLDDLAQTRTLLGNNEVTAKLSGVSKRVIAKANGTIAPRLLSFINSGRATRDCQQLAYVCSLLRKQGEISNPVYATALRRAAAWGRLFELKVLVKSIDKELLNAVDLRLQRSALHWAVASKKIDCVRYLIQAGIDLDAQDYLGKTALHLAVHGSDKVLINALHVAGASLDIKDKQQQSPKDCAVNDEIKQFMEANLTPPAAAHSLTI